MDCKDCDNKEKVIAEKIIVSLMPVYGFLLLELPYNEMLWLMDMKNRILGIGISLFIFFIIYGITIRKKIALIAYLTCNMFLGIINGFVIIFKNAPIMPNDFFVWNTALEVVGQYKLVPTRRMLESVFLFVFLIVVVVWLIPSKNEKYKNHWKIASIGGAVAGVVCFAAIDYISAFSMVIDDWQPVQTYYKYGFLTSFGAYTQKIQVKPPEGYSKQHVNEILDSVNDLEKTTEEYPTIIAIMNESYADLKVLQEFECEPEYMPFWNKEHDFDVFGDLYVSAYGGGTANTEFEFLTGNSTTNIGVGAYPYQIYNFSKIPNLARTLKQYGYDTVAIHPENPNNWKRAKVYKEMGFDKFLSEKDFKNPLRIRNYISDKSSYEKVIETFEASKNPSFIFNVTMQNHGGYLTGNYSEEQLVTLSNDLQHYPDVREYITLLHESDQALEELLNYFENVERPVIICFFGDHQPGLAHAFGKDNMTIEEIQRRYITPYFIWSNYDNINSQDEVISKDISVNYLGAVLLEKAGLAESKQNRFLLDMSKKIPIYNCIAYRNEAGEWKDIEWGETSTNEWIQKYKILQYYYMFDQ